MANEATKPQTKHVDTVMLPISSPNYSQAYLRVCGSQEQVAEKSDFIVFPHLSHSQA